jgi:hypothetical protein
MPTDRKPRKFSPDKHGRITVINLKGPVEQRDRLDRASRETLIPASCIVRAALDLWFAKHDRESFSGNSQKTPEATS